MREKIMLETYNTLRDSEARGRCVTLRCVQGSIVYHLQTVLQRAIWIGEDYKF